MGVPSGENKKEGAEKKMTFSHAQNIIFLKLERGLATERGGKGGGANRGNAQPFYRRQDDVRRVLFGERGKRRAKRKRASLKTCKNGSETCPVDAAGRTRGPGGLKRTSGGGKKRAEGEPEGKNCCTGLFHKPDPTEDSLGGGGDS